MKGSFFNFRRAGVGRVFAYIAMVLLFVGCADAHHIPIRGSFDTTPEGVNHIVSTKAIINIYDMPSTSSDVVDQIEYGYLLKAVATLDAKWAKAYHNKEMIGYIESEHITSKRMYKRAGTYTEYMLFNYTRPVNYLVFLFYFFGALAALSAFGLLEVGLPATVQYILLPLICFVYFKYCGDPMWLCRPSSVGWLIAIPFFLLTAIICGQFLAGFLGGVKSLVNIFNDPLETIIMVVAGFLSGMAFMQICAEIIVEFTWVIIALLACAGSSQRQFVGTFTSLSGEVHGVYR